MTLNPALDYVMHPLTLDMGYTNRSSSEELHCGGNGINISTLLKEVGTPSIAMGIAAGFTGDYLLKRLQEKGISSNFVCLDNGFTRINVKLNGIVMTMCNGMGPKISEKKVYELLDRMDVIGAGDTLVLTGSIPNSLPSDMYDQIMKRFAGRGIPFLIKPNNHEVGRIYGVNIESPEECMPYAHKLQEEGARNVIISCGGHGSLLLDENGAEHIVPTARIRLVNATGAGDSMVGGFLSMVTRGADYDTALVFASACGTATAASKGIANRNKINRVVTALYKKMGRAIPGIIANDMQIAKDAAAAREVDSKQQEAAEQFKAAKGIAGGN